MPNKIEIGNSADKLVIFVRALKKTDKIWYISVATLNFISILFIAEVTVKLSQIHFLGTILVVEILDNKKLGLYHPNLEKYVNRYKQYED